MENTNMDGKDSPSMPRRIGGESLPQTFEKIFVQPLHETLQLTIGSFGYSTPKNGNYKIKHSKFGN